MTAWTGDHLQRLRFPFRTRKHDLSSLVDHWHKVCAYLRPYQQRDNVICFMFGRKCHFRRMWDWLTRLQQLLKRKGKPGNSTAASER